jgi:hypothetical protein
LAAKVDVSPENITLNVHNYWLVNRVERAVQWVLEQVREMHTIWPKIIDRAAGNKISEPVDGAYFTIIIVLIELSYRKTFAAEVIKSITENIIEV